ncbi:hypothetical protein DM02DRAFT_90115 [Periconia macrospinosa]|uniref:Uncharacterized protein n=1 Tax=Periconia macrospinosa TaxID=97972 RepID=A0A2V1DGP3_9PLEO|nr:hypothetical protein DM02DRAFT_90115 [Periconia macrospinosa]
MSEMKKEPTYQKNWIIQKKRYPYLAYTVPYHTISYRTVPTDPPTSQCYSISTSPKKTPISYQYFTLHTLAGIVHTVHKLFIATSARA